MCQTALAETRQKAAMDTLSAQAFVACTFT